jgi:hypothetical protein
MSAGRPGSCHVGLNETDPVAIMIRARRGWRKRWDRAMRWDRRVQW